jgi:hypothetical protein
MGIIVAIERESCVSPAGFSDRFKNGEYTFANEKEYQKWLAGNPNLAVSRINAIIEKGTKAYVGYVQRT